MDQRYDVVAFGARPDDLEVVMGGTAAKLASRGQSILFVDLCAGEPARHAGRGARHAQAASAAAILGVQRTTLALQDRLIRDSVEAGLLIARLPKWDELADGHALDGTEPHEIERLFFGHCRMEPAWSGFDFAVDVSAAYAQKMAASAEDRYVGSLVGVPYAEAFKASSPLLVDSPDVFAKSRFG